MIFKRLMVGFKGCNVMELEFIMFGAIRMVNGYLPKRIQVDLDMEYQASLGKIIK